MYDFNDISIEGLRNVLSDHIHFTNTATREELIAQANILLDNGMLDEIELIIEESGE